MDAVKQELGELRELTNRKETEIAEMHVKAEEARAALEESTARVAELQGKVRLVVHQIRSSS